MLHIATPHYRTPRWVEIQTSYLREHISVPYRTWGSLERIDSSYAVHFDRVIEQRGRYPGKLNHLALEISQEASGDDLLMFLAGDTFPIADPMPLIDGALSRAPLLAARRSRGERHPQPHPCFCVTTVGAWRELPGDWSGGYAWRDGAGELLTDVGGNLLRQLQLSGTPWVEVTRSNLAHGSSLLFAVYGDVIYHHGADFPTSESGEASYEQEVEERDRHRDRSEVIFRGIREGGAEWMGGVG